MNPVFSSARKVIKFIRSNNRPHALVKHSRATFGITLVSSATSSALKSNPYRLFDRYSTRSGNIVRFANPISIQLTSVHRNTGSSPTTRNARNGCVPAPALTTTAGHRRKHAAPTPKATAYVTITTGHAP